MSCSDEPAILAFKGAIEASDPVTLLLTAEAGGYGRDPSVAPRSAAAAVATALGYPLSHYRDSTQGVMIGFVLTRLHDLNALGYTTLASLITDNPRGNRYAYSYG